MKFSKLTLKHVFVIMFFMCGTFLLYMDKITAEYFVGIVGFIAGYLFKNGKDIVEDKVGVENA